MGKKDFRDIWSWNIPQVACWALVIGVSVVKLRHFGPMQPTAEYTDFRCIADLLWALCFLVLCLIHAVLQLRKGV